ncbi:MAG: hypothetical protein K1X74_19790 [Pirellulales bacterium]|nr:hypothetical protein [Pirellulales bacterium]
MIRTSGRTGYRISKDTGIDAATLSRFMTGKGGLSPANLDTLGHYFGWVISAKAIKPRTAKKAR